MRQLLSLDARRATQLDLAIDNLLTNGTRPYLFARRKLTREETRGFVKTYKNLKQNLSLQEESLITLFDELEDNLKFIGMCGIE
jgi:magnesium-transporting ATPase (P-type)